MQSAQALRNWTDTARPRHQRGRCSAVAVARGFRCVPVRPAGRCGSELSLCCRAVSTGAAGPTCQYATVRSSQALRGWGVSALSCNRPEGGGPDVSLHCRAIRTGATDPAFERATLQSAAALRIVTTQPYDQPRRNVSEVTLRCQRRRCGSGVSLGCRAKDRALRIWIVTVLPCPPLGRCGYGVSVRRCAIGTSTSTMDLKCCYAVV